MLISKDQVQNLIQRWHNIAAMQNITLCEPPPDEFIRRISKEFQILDDDPILLYFRQFQAEAYCKDDYLQYGLRIIQFNESIRENDGWLPNNLVQVPSAEAVFYLDPRGGCSTFKASILDQYVQIIVRDHEIHDPTVYKDFARWLEEELITMLMMSLK